MHKYTDLTDTEPSYQGGFIWDYNDQSIYKKDRYGKGVSGFTAVISASVPRTITSAETVLFTAVSGDESPKMQEVKFNYQNISAVVDKRMFASSIRIFL